MQTSGMPPPMQNSGMPPPMGGMPPPMQQNGMPPAPQHQQQQQQQQQMTQGMSNMSMGMPPAMGGQQQGMPPMQQQQGMPPMQQQGMPPMQQQQQQGMPPMQQQQGMPPMPPMQQQQGMQQQQPGMPPVQQQQGMPPMQQQQQGVPPMQQQQGVPPMQQQQGMPPMQQQQGMPPPMGGGMPPPMGGQQQQQGMPPPTGGGMPPPTGGGMPPPTGGQQQARQGGVPPLMGGGMPPQMGGQPQPGGANRWGQTQAPQQKKGIDPDQIPNPITVNATDQETYSSANYATSSQLPPPMVNTKCDIVDDGNCSPLVMRSSMYNIPATDELMNNCGVPLSFVIQPLADPTGKGTPVPIVDHGPDGPIRCERCRAYMSPGFAFIDGGRKFRCNFCHKVCDVPDSYFCNLDHTGMRHDIMSRPELMLGTVEYKATSAYCVNKREPKPISYLFVIDVSYSAIKSGMVASAAQAISELLDEFPKVDEASNSDTKIGIITFDRHVNFYNLAPVLERPQMMVVTDVNDPFVPLKEGLLVNVNDSRDVIEDLLSQLPHMFQHTRDTEPVLGAALKASLEALTGNGGKMMIFSSAMPTTGPGKMKNREDQSLLGTDKETQLLKPQINFYQELAYKCVEQGISADLFICNNGYYDIATIGMLAYTTGGSVFPFRGFQSPQHGLQLRSSVRRVITRKHGYDAMMTMRASEGLRPTDFCGSFRMVNTKDVEIAGIDEDKALVIECKHDAALTESRPACFQVALLYTTATGQRVIRVHTLMLRVCSAIADVFRGTDMEAVITTICKQTVRDHRREAIAQLRGNLKARSVKMLSAYRKHCTPANSSPGQLILPDCLKLLPCLMSAIFKNPMLKGGNTVGSDERMETILFIIGAPVKSTVAFIYPRLIQIDDLGDTGFPAAIRPSYQRLKQHGAYILDNGRSLMLWIGTNISSTFCQQVLDASAFQSIDTNQTKLPKMENPSSARVQQIVDTIAHERHTIHPIRIVKQKDPAEAFFASALVEDKSNDALSYVDFLCLVHREIQNASS